MRRILFVFAILASLLGSLAPAEAYRFGKQEDIHHIEDVKLKGANDEALFLAYMARTYNFVAGLYIEDAGYVLGVKGDSKKFYRMPEGAELARFQRDGFLPNPLPTYSLSTFDYIMGYSLWWIAVFVALYFVWDSRRKKQKREAEAAAPPPPAATA